MIEASRPMGEPFSMSSVGLTEPASGTLYPKSHPKLVSVEGIAMSGDGTQATVDFKWFWVGGPMENTENLFLGHALFKLYDDGWRIDESALRASLAQHERA